MLNLYPVAGGELVVRSLSVWDLVKHVHFCVLLSDCTGSLLASTGNVVRFKIVGLRIKKLKCTYFGTDKE